MFPLEGLDMVLLLKCLTSFFLINAFAKPQEKIQKIILGTTTIHAEIADSSQSREKGLMNRKSLPENAGMLFVFDEEDYRTFWMKNTFIDLSIGYFDKNKFLLEIVEMKSVKSEMETPQVYPSKYRAKYALEMNAGWFKKHKIAPGAQFKFSENK